MDGQTSQPIEDRYSSRVDEPQPVEEAEEEWVDDDADEDSLALSAADECKGRPPGRPLLPTRSLDHLREIWYTAPFEIETT